MRVDQENEKLIKDFQNITKILNYKLIEVFTKKSLNHIPDAQDLIGFGELNRLAEVSFLGMHRQVVFFFLYFFQISFHRWLILTLGSRHLKEFKNQMIELLTVIFNKLLVWPRCF